MNKVGILALASEKSGVYQYTQSIIDALLLDTENKYIIFTYKCNLNTQLGRPNVEVKKIEKPNLKVFQKIIRLLFVYMGFKKPLFFTPPEIKLFEDIGLFISPTIATYPLIFLNKPYIFTLHDMQEKYFPEFFTLKERILRYLTNKLVTKNASHILCESEFVKKDIIKYIGVSEQKVTVIPSPPPTAFLHRRHSENELLDIRAKYNLPKKYIFYPAHFWPHKNHLRLLEAFKQICIKYNDVCLVLTGSKQNYYNNVRDKIEALKLKERVYYLGFVNYRDLPGLYRMSKMLVMPSLFESVSIPIYESFSLKIPVCCSNIGALPEQVGNGGLTFDPYNPHDISDKIEKILNDDNFAKKLAENGYKKISNFDHVSYSKNLVKMIKNI